MDLFDGWPPTVIPSKLRQGNTTGDDMSTWKAGSFMSLAERIETAAQARSDDDNVPDKYYPEKEFETVDKVTKFVDRLIETKKSSLGIKGMRHLMKLLLNSPEDIQSAIDIAVARRKHDKVLEELKKANASTGIEKVVSDFVATQCEKSNVEHLQHVLQQRFSVPKDQVKLCRAMLVQRLYVLLRNAGDIGTQSGPDAVAGPAAAAGPPTKSWPIFGAAGVDADSCGSVSVATGATVSDTDGSIGVDVDIVDATLSEATVEQLVEQAIVPEEEMSGVSAAEILDEDRWDYLEAATQTEYSVSDGGASIGGGRYPGRDRKRPRHKF